MTRLLRLPVYIAAAITAFLVLGWVFYALEANEANWLVGLVMDVARFFAEPFRFIFRLEDNVLQIAVNWGIAALVYLVAGALLSRVLSAIGSAMQGGGSSHPRRTSAPTS